MDGSPIPGEGGSESLDFAGGLECPHCGKAVESTDVVCPWCGEILDEEAGERESEALQEAVEMTVRDASMGNVGYTLMAAIAGVSLLLASVCLTAIPWLWHTLAGATN